MRSASNEYVVEEPLFGTETFTLGEALAEPRVEASSQPERRLMLAVFEEAIRAYRRCAAQSTHLKRRQFREVERWVHSSDATWLYSFESICAALGFEPSAVRRALASLRTPPRRGEQRHTVGRRGWNLRKIG